MAHAQENLVQAQYLNSPPTIDGEINPDEWGAASTMQGLYDSSTGDPAIESGKFWLGYDTEFVYFAAQLEDHQPEKIKASEYRTNVSLGTDDMVAIGLDTFASFAESNVFTMNHRGGTRVSIAGGRAAKREWVGEFISRGRVTPEGWEVEARIPWAVMKLPAPGERDIIFNIYRYSNRLQRQYAWRYTAGGRRSNLGRWLGVQIPQPPPRRLKLLPYTYLGHDEEEFVSNSGLDLKVPLNDQIELVGTINPDFRNIENDILSLDFSYFERLAGETRPFFLEGVDYFGTSSDAPIFASQRLEEFDAGLKAYGKLDSDTTFAFLDTADFGNQNAVAFNGRRQFSPTSSAQIAYSGFEENELRNDVGFLQMRKSYGAYDFFGQHSFSTDSEEGSGQRNNYGFSYGSSGISGVLEYSSVTEKYLPRIGFAPQRDFRGLSGNLGMVRPLKSGALLEDGWSIFFKDWNDFDGNEYVHSHGASGSLTWRDGMDLDFGFERPSFKGSNDKTFFVTLKRPRGDANRYAYLGYRWGEIGGDPLRQYEATLRYKPIERLQLGVTHQTRNLGLTDRLTIVSANYDLGSDRAISGRLVSHRGDTNWYLSYRRSGGRGAEYYVILGDPNARTFQKSLILKMVVPFEVRF